MQIEEIRQSGTAIGTLDGSRHEVDISLIEEAAIGDYVIVHAGFAIEKLDREEADERLNLFSELAASWQEAAVENGV
ncbi:MAG: HypC/HybG/HupF family hydrogenase formation chaperone [Rhodocyclaceae bacterium]|nr:MAG: HypC/HybG/HupF family hydrogenase formation chaperone [Rhodocyclaceae bacterium]